MSSPSVLHKVLDWEVGKLTQEERLKELKMSTQQNDMSELTT
jgi:hypothetical protein